MSLGYGEQGGDFVDAQDVSLSFFDYEGIPLSMANLSASFSTGGDGFWVESCECGLDMSGEAYFTGLVITIDYSNITERTGWAEQVMDGNGFIGMVILPSIYQELGATPQSCSGP